MRPLGFMVADKNMEACVHGLLSRSEWQKSIGCSLVDVAPQDVHVAAGHADPGLYSRGRDLLRPHAGSYEHMVVMVDAEWAGSPDPRSVQMRMREHLNGAGWSDDRSLALVFEPEVDLWLWTKTDHTARALGWPAWSQLDAALAAAGHWPPDAPKPPRPKEAAEWALRRQRKPRSSSVYRDVTANVGLGRCTDASYVALRNALQTWFPQAGD
jgi:hypothetical protein